MKSRLLPLVLLAALPAALSAQQDEGTTLQPLAPSALPAATPTPADPVPPALAADLTAFVKDELAAQQGGDAGRAARFYVFPLEDEGRTTNAADFRRAWTEFTRKFTRRTLETMTVKFLAYDSATDTAELQQTYGSETQPAGRRDSEKMLLVRQLRVVHAGRPARAIDRRFTAKQFWTYDARLSAADHPQRDRLAKGGPQDTVKAILLQDRANYYSGRPDGRDPDDDPCAYFDDPAHRALLLQANVKLIPDTPATLEAILQGTPRVRVSFSDNLHGENRDGYPVLNVGVLDR